MEASDTNGKFHHCITACAKCAQACYECFYASLNEQDIHARKKYASILMECAMICQTTAAVLSMNGLYYRQFCQLCSEICEKCALECTPFTDEHCQNCQEICRRCAISCRSLTDTI